MTIKRVTSVLVVAALTTLSSPGFTQAVRQTEAIAQSDILSQIAMFSYREGRKSDIVFRGTPIAALAEGEGEVQYKDGNSSISVEFEDLPEPSSLGPFAVYVLWALTPDGRAVNQGVVATGGGDGELDTTYGASQMALIVTAEPHFAVSLPSSMIVLYNVADNVRGDESRVSTVTEQADYSALARRPVDNDNGSEIVQARYSIAIARASGAERYAAPAFQRAEQKLNEAETLLQGRRSDRRMALDAAREATLLGEDARRVALTGAAEAAAAAERAEAAAAAERAAAVQSAAASRAAAAQAAAEEAAVARRDLRNRLNAALPTRETERGLVSEIGGVQFATGTSDLNSSARESLARFAGVVASYPDLDFMIEGHTDNTGGAAINNELSLQRAIAVRDYLTSQGVPSSRMDVAGLGSTRPVASNETSDGRARNRRVEIVVSGGPLGIN